MELQIFDWMEVMARELLLDDMPACAIHICKL